MKLVSVWILDHTANSACRVSSRFGPCLRPATTTSMFRASGDAHLTTSNVTCLPLKDPLQPDNDPDPPEYSCLFTDIGSGPRKPSEE